MVTEQYITTEKARKELGDEAYFAFHRWLTEKGYRNLDDKYVTGDQLNEFIKETAQFIRGVLPTNEAWGQTRELLRSKKLPKRVKNKEFIR
jgi:hypothetical protein